MYRVTATLRADSSEQDLGNWRTYEEAADFASEFMQRWTFLYLRCLIRFCTPTPKGEQL